MEIPPTVAVPVEKSPTTPIDNIHTEHNYYADCQKSICHRESICNKIPKEKLEMVSELLPATSPIKIKTMSITQPVEDSIFISTDPSEDDTKSQCVIDVNKSLVLFVRQILEEALGQVYGKADLILYSKEKITCPQKCFSKGEKIKTYPSSQNDHHSFSPSPSQNKICDLGFEQLQSTEQQTPLSKMDPIEDNNFTSIQKDILCCNNNANELVLFDKALTTQKYERKYEYDFSILKTILRGGDYFPPYLPNGMTIRNILASNSKETKTVQHKCDERVYSISQMQKETLANIGCCSTFKDDQMVRSCENVDEHNISTEKSTGFAATVSSTVSLLNDKLETSHSSFLQSNQTIPNVFTSRVLQSTFLTSTDGLVQTQTEETRAQRIPSQSGSYSNYISLPKETRDLERIASSSNCYPTNDCHEVKTLDLLNILTVKRTKRVIESCSSDKIGSRKVHLNISCSVTEHHDIDNSINSSTTEMEMLNSVPSICHPIINSSLVAVSDNSNTIRNEEAKKPSHFDHYHLFDSSNSSWSDIEDIKKNVNTAEIRLDKIISEKNANKHNFLKKPGGDMFAAYLNDSDSDDLDRMIDDSIEKYENFTVDASVSATPSTAEKSCQTEMQNFEKVARCKRCLCFDEEPTEPLKKKKTDFGDELKSPTEGNSHIGSDVSPAHSMVYRQILDGSERLYNSAERELNYLMLPGTFGDQSVTRSERLPEYENSRDESFESDTNASLFEDNMNQSDWSNESTYDSDQEVPLNLHASEDEYDETTDTSSESDYFEALEELQNAKKL